MISVFFGPALAFILTIVGVLALRYAWADSARGRLPVFAGWSMLVLALPGWTAVAALDKAVALTMLAPSLVAFPVIAAGVEYKRAGPPRRPRRDAAELTAEFGRTRRLVSRTILAGPVAALAASALGMAVCLRAPMGEADRLILGGFLVPLAWAVFAGWALADTRVGRVLTILGLVTAGGGAGMFL